AESVGRPSSVSAAGPQQTGWPMRAASRRRFSGRREREDDGRTKLDKNGNRSDNSILPASCGGGILPAGVRQTRTESEGAGPDTRPKRRSSDDFLPSHTNSLPVGELEINLAQLRQKVL